MVRQEERKTKGKEKTLPEKQLPGTHTYTILFLKAKGKGRIRCSSVVCAGRQSVRRIGVLSVCCFITFMMCMRRSGEITYPLTDAVHIPCWWPHPRHTTNNERDCYLCSDSIHTFMFVVVPVSDEHTPPKSHLASLSTTRTKLRCKPPPLLLPLRCT